MPDPHNHEKAVRERAYFIWQREGCPEGKAQDHWTQAVTEASGEQSGRYDHSLEEEEKLLAGRADVNLPALLTKDVPGG